MTDKSAVFSNSNAQVTFEGHLDSIVHSSGAILKASIIAPRDIIDGLPEELLRWLHEDLDRDNLPDAVSRHASRIDFESIIVDRLFPLRDTRPFIRRLRSHCHATATAAGILADIKGQPPKFACVCGWLHDIGLAACMRHVDEVFRIGDEASLAKLWPTIVRSSAQHGIRLASRWRLPSAIRHSIRDHQSSLLIDAPSPTVANSIVAEHVATLIGYGFHEQAPAQAIERAMSALGFGEREVHVTAVRTEKVMRHSRFENPTMPISQGA